MSDSAMKHFSLGNALFGRRLATDEAPHQTIGKTIGLAVFASDALSSVAVSYTHLTLPTSDLV